MSADNRDHIDESIDESSVWMQDHTWQEVEQYAQRTRVTILPVGSTEQHGPAGVLGVDGYVATTLAEDVARRCHVLVAPPIWYGDSLHHGAFPGTLSVRADTLRRMVRDVVSSLSRHGLDRVIVINGHKGSNIPALTIALRELHDNTYPNGIFVVADPLQLARSIAPNIKGAREHHSGELELSQVHYRVPGSVRMDRLTDAGVDFDAVFGGFVGNDLFGPGPDGVDIIFSGEDERAFAPTGSFSSSRGVSADKGKAYHEHMVGRLADVVTWLEKYDGPVGGSSAATPKV